MTLDVEERIITRIEGYKTKWINRVHKNGRGDSGGNRNKEIPPKICLKVVSEEMIQVLNMLNKTLCGHKDCQKERLTPHHILTKHNKDIGVVNIIADLRLLLGRDQITQQLTKASAELKIKYKKIYDILNTYTVSNK